MLKESFQKLRDEVIESRSKAVCTNHEDAYAQALRAMMGVRKEKPKEAVFVEVGGLSYLHKEFQYHIEGIFIDKWDSTNNWSFKYIRLPIVEEVDGQEIVHQELIAVFDGSDYGKKMGYPPR